jgi:hypothetical protein
MIMTQFDSSRPCATRYKAEDRSRNPYMRAELEAVAKALGVESKGKTMDKLCRELRAISASRDDDTTKSSRDQAFVPKITKIKSYKKEDNIKNKGKSLVNIASDISLPPEEALINNKNNNKNNETLSDRRHHAAARNVNNNTTSVPDAPLDDEKIVPAEALLMSNAILLVASNTNTNGKEETQPGCAADLPKQQQKDMTDLIEGLAHLVATSYEDSTKPNGNNALEDDALALNKVCKALAQIKASNSTEVNHDAVRAAVAALRERNAATKKTGQDQKSEKKVACAYGTMVACFRTVGLWVSIFLAAVFIVTTLSTLYPAQIITANHNMNTFVVAIRDRVPELATKYMSPMFGSTFFVNTVVNFCNEMVLDLGFPSVDAIFLNIFETYNSGKLIYRKRSSRPLSFDVAYNLGVSWVKAIAYVNGKILKTFRVPVKNFRMIPMFARTTGMILGFVSYFFGPGLVLGYLKKAAVCGAATLSCAFGVSVSMMKSAIKKVGSMVCGRRNKKTQPKTVSNRNHNHDRNIRNANNK